MNKRLQTNTKTMEISYAELRQEKPFDWFEFLKRDSYTLLELTTAQSKSLDWVTCACGQQCSIIPREYHGEPEDLYLRDLGFLFAMAIGGMVSTYDTKRTNLFLDHKNYALFILLAIEDRSAEIIAQIRGYYEDKSDNYETTLRRK
jgi:hypothetical protein